MNRRGSLTFGIILILLGAWFLATTFIPEIGAFMDRFADWPVWVVGPGLIFMVAALISGVFELFIPGSIISGIGLILYYQSETGDWQSWSYAWALIVVSVGVGVFLSHLFRGEFRKAFSEGGPPIVTGSILFIIFGSIFRATFGQEPFFGDYWPILLIAAGLLILGRSLFRTTKRKEPKVIVNIESGDEAEIYVEEPQAEEDWEKELDNSFEDDEEEEPPVQA